MTEPRSGLAVSRLTVDHHDARGDSAVAVRNVSFTIAPGESLALVGESGCGKSSIALAVARLEPANASVTGAVDLDGTDVLGLAGAGLRRWWSREVAMVFQDPQRALNPTMTVGRQVAEVLGVLGATTSEARRGAAALLARVALTDASIAGRYPHQLSGGQQQRVVIAMALAVEPRLLILDEPTTGLDAAVEAGVLQLVAELRQELGAAVLYITHDLGLVPTICDRIAVLYAGEIVEHGDVATVLDRPEHPYTRGLLASVPRDGRTKDTAPLTPIPGSLPPAGAEPAGCAFADRCEHVLDMCLAGPVALVARPDSRHVRCVRAAELSGPPRPSPSRPAPSPSWARSSPSTPQIDDRAVLALHGITKRFGAVTAVDGVSLRIAPGEIVGLVGESGSGKSTLARIITGLTAPDAGRVSWHGDDLAVEVRRRSPAARVALQMVFQHPEATLNPRHRVGAILGRAIAKLGGERSVEQLAAECQIDASLLERRAATLSGGQQQRVAIARAIAGDPQLVVCDEPVSALDVSVQAGILALLVELQRQRRTSLLFISHDLAVVEYLADRIAVMQHGRIVDEGPAAKVLAPPHHPYTATLLAARDRPDARPDLRLAPITSG